MKLSLKKQNELIVWEYFIPKNCQWMEKTDRDIEKFFEWSEQGKHRDVMQIATYKTEGRTYAHALYWGKKWAGIHVHELYEKGILDGSMPYCSFINKDVPRPVIEFLKKEIFKGKDSEIIENYYQSKI